MTPTHRNKRIDLSGKLFGDLRPLSPGPSKNGKSTWLCRCEACGKEKLIKTQDLLYGRATSCGCQWKKRGVQQLQYVNGSCIEMLASQKLRHNNSTGHTGVYYDPQRRKYRAEITLQGKRHYLGRYASLEEAVAAREKAHMELHQAFIEKHTRNESK